MSLPPSIERQARACPAKVKLWPPRTCTRLSLPPAAASLFMFVFSARFPPQGSPQQLGLSGGFCSTRRYQVTLPPVRCGRGEVLMLHTFPQYQAQYHTVYRASVYVTKAIKSPVSVEHLSAVTCDGYFRRHFMFFATSSRKSCI